jgi:hypothetical protein
MYYIPYRNQCKEFKCQKNVKQQGGPEAKRRKKLLGLQPIALFATEQLNKCFDFALL